jgi:arginyl-tRNA synthetase
MNFQIDKKIFENYPDFKLGLIIIKNLDNTRRISAVESLLRGVTAQKGKEFKNKDVDAEAMIKVWNQAYGSFGINPKKDMPSVAALLKKAQSGDEIPHISSIADISNYFSMKFLLPIGTEDLDWLCGDLHLTYTNGGEPFRAINSIEVEESNEGEIAYMDDGGITSKYWNNRECERTKITNKSTNVAIFIEDLSNMHMDEFGEVLNEIANTINKYIGGDIMTFLMNDENQSINLGVQGRKNVDDSKVSAQEKAYFITQQQRKIDAKAEREAPIEDKKDEKPKEKKEKKENKMELKDDSLLKERVRDVLERAIVKAFSKPLNVDAKIDYPSSHEHGDYASNIALSLSKELGMSPREIAQKLKDQISKEDFIEDVEIAGPGFLNFFISAQELDKELCEVLDKKENYGNSDLGGGKIIIVEYSSPNIAKPLGVHHLITTILGQSLYNIYKKIGFNAVSINHLGDWGTQFGKLIYAYKQWGDRKLIEENPIDELLKLYVRFHDEAEKDEKLEDEARAEFKKFEEGDKENHKLWEWFVEESMKDIQKTFDKLGGIHFDYVQGESFYEDKLADILAEGKQRGVFTEGNEGSFIVKYEDENMPPFLVQKKDSATLYSTRDFAALKYRVGNWHPVKILYVVDIAQTLHFKQLFEAAKRFTWYNDEGVHVWFGRMHMKDKKMSTRKGNVILLDEVLDECIERAKKVVEERGRDFENLEKIAETIGIAAIKYNILSQNRTTDITFDWDRMLSIDGNSAPYIQYAYARAKSILRNAGDVKVIDGVDDPESAEEKTRLLIRLLPKFKEEIINAAQEYKVNILTNYLYCLAQEFNSFYNVVPVIKTKDTAKRQARLELVEGVSWILKNGLALLGIEVVEEM